MLLFAPCPGRVDAAEISSIVDERIQLYSLDASTPSLPAFFLNTASILYTLYIFNTLPAGRPGLRVRWVCWLKIYSASSLHDLQGIITKPSNPRLIFSAAIVRGSCTTCR